MIQYIYMIQYLCIYIYIITYVYHYCIHEVYPAIYNLEAPPRNEL